MAATSRMSRCWISLIGFVQVVALGFKHDPGVLDPLGRRAWIGVAAHRFPLAAQMMPADLLGRREQVLAQVHQRPELVELEYQIAQQIHAVTDPGFDRAHDLVDLQLLWNAVPDLPRLSALCISG